MFKGYFKDPQNIYVSVKTMMCSFNENVMVFREGRPNRWGAPLNRGSPKLRGARGAPQINFLTDEGRPNFLPKLQRFVLCRMDLLHINSVGGLKKLIVVS